MSDVTQLLNAIDAGDPQAAAALLPLVYDELRRLAAAQLARENPGHSLQATALVHEAYLRLSASGVLAAPPAIILPSEKYSAATKTSKSLRSALAARR